ncbi:MAG: hypothetical protein OXU37_08560 [Thaumarchaeota archaeon]|nr:hypothetical protein [Nitrososphaerota archaeon]
MDIPLQVADVRFAARCALLGNTDQELLGVVDSGSNATCVDVRTCKRAGLKFAGESADVKCIHRNHREVLRSYFGLIDICGRTGHTTVYELDMGPECEREGINAILGWDVLGDFRIVLDMPGRTGHMERRRP